MWGLRVKAYEGTFCETPKCLGDRRLIIIHKVCVQKRSGLGFQNVGNRAKGTSGACSYQIFVVTACEPKPVTLKPKGYILNRKP